MKRPVERRDTFHRCACDHARGEHARNEGECLLDSCDCILFRQRESHRAGPRAVGQGRRVNKQPKIGDRFGAWRVVRVIGRGHRGRSDLRLELVCKCGARTETYEFNARRLGACTHG